MPSLRQKLGLATESRVVLQCSNTAIFGDSIIRDIDESKLVNTKIHCHGGAHIEDIKKDLDKLGNEEKLDNLILVAGTNDAVTCHQIWME